MSDAVDPTHSPAGPSEEEEAWSLVLASWEDEAAHRAYLGRFSDLAGCAVAGGRYRAVLAERPQDAVALRMRDEVVKKATVLGLSSLPRTRRAEAPRWRRRFVMLIALVGGVAAVAAAGGALVRLMGAGS
jgi:hypothetical protein